ncbi:MAG: TAXI family TRAP transporter solute-binding subunit [Alphaproteobacteria bacterium]|nr:TAXI family TRAP transporter solute-binding subunit [Alphaproteobacteria bacterium]
MRHSGFVAALGVALAAAAPAAAQDKLPASISATAYDTGSNGFNQIVAVGQMVKARLGVDMRVLPAGNDTGRMAPLKSGRAQISANGIGTYFAQEGVLDFATKDWGPQPARLILSSSSCNGQAMGVAKDTGVKTVADIKGKRLGLVRGAPAINQSMYALIAFAGYTPKDVQLVEFSSYGALWKGIMNNEADIGFASTISGQAKEAENSSRGIVWPEFPASDTAGWARVNKVASYFYPHKSTCGAGYPAGASYELPVYPYPIFIAYTSQSEGAIYQLTKAMIDHYADYRDAVVGVDGLEAKRQNLTWSMPYHAGAVRALKEAGVWTEAAERHNTALVKRQELLGGTWQAFLKTSPPEDKDAFRVAWMKVREAALTSAGLDLGYND